MINWSQESVEKVAEAIYSITPDLDKRKGTSPWYSTTLVELPINEACDDSVEIAKRRAKAALSVITELPEVRGLVEALNSIAHNLAAERYVREFAENALRPFTNKGE